VGTAGMTTARARRERWSAEGQMGAAAIPSGFGNAFLGQCHDEMGVYQASKRD
jgi:hypothetical protein